MPEESCPQCGGGQFKKGRRKEAQLWEGLRLVQVQCKQCGWKDGYGFEIALPKYIVPGDFTSRPISSTHDSALRLLEVFGGRSQDTGESELSVEEFVLKTYDPLVGFTDSVRPMRVVQTWEGVGPAQHTVDLNEPPWVLFWTVKDSASLGGTFTLLVTQEGTSSAEVIDSGSGTNYAVMQTPGVQEIAVQAVDVNWQVRILLEDE